MDDSAASRSSRRTSCCRASRDGRTARKGGSWAINAMRDTERLPRHAVLAAATPFGFAGGTRITVRIDHLDGTIGQGIGRFRLSVTDAADPLEGADLAPRLRPVLDVPAARAHAGTSRGDRRRRSARPAPLLKPTRDALAAARKALADLQIPSTLVMKERASFERPSFELRVRGSFAAKGERVYAAHARRRCIRCATISPSTGSGSRGGWSTRTTRSSRASRSIGSGSRSSAGDSSRRARTSARRARRRRIRSCSTGWPREFIAKGWSQKALLRTIVLSATYRQSSAVTPQLAERDPYNRLLARGPRFRMEAEMVRDVALAASGLLSPKMYGPSVFPLQPDGIWNMPYNADKWTTSAGEDRYRRSLYTFWRRTSPYPSFMTFDATSREFCTVRRVRTNTPLQALTLLNDPASFEAAGALAGADDAAAPGSGTPSAGPGARAQVAHARPSASSWSLSRRSEAEPSSIASCPLYEQELMVTTGRAEPMSRAPSGSMDMVANVLLNLDESGDEMKPDHSTSRPPVLRTMTRRHFFEQASFGIGGLALASLMDDVVLASRRRSRRHAAGRRPAVRAARSSASSISSWPARRRRSICSIRSRR